MPTLQALLADGEGTADIKKKWNGLTLHIQTPADGIRRGVDKEGNHWSQRIPFAYGEIVGTEGIDKEPVDCIVGDHLGCDGEKVYIVQMPKAKSGEDKCMLGFLTISAAKKGFLACYGGDVAFFGKIKSVSVRMFKLLLNRHSGKSLIQAMVGYDYDYRLTALQPLPTGWNTEVDNPGDRELTPIERQYNTENARHQGGQPTYPTVALVAPTASINYVYSMKAGGPGSGRHKGLILRGKDVYIAKIVEALKYNPNIPKGSTIVVARRLKGEEDADAGAYQNLRLIRLFPDSIKEHPAYIACMLHHEGRHLQQDDNVKHKELDALGHEIDFATAKLKNSILSPNERKAFNTSVERATAQYIDNKIASYK